MANEYVDEGLKLQKFDSVVRIAKLSSFKKENIQDYLVFDDLSFKKDTVYFNLKYAIEGLQVNGKLVRSEDIWTVYNYVMVENMVSESKPSISEAPKEIAVRTIAYKGADLGYLGQRYYGNKAYRHVLSAYNNFVDKRRIDKKNDSIKIPELLNLSKDTDLPKLILISDELGKVLKVRSLYAKQESLLWDLPFNTENRNFRSVPQALKLELLGAAKLMYEAVAGLEKQENPPKKAIGQFKQVAENLENIAQGNIDQNGYAIDMVNQRLAHGLANCIKWAKEGD